MPRIWGDPFYLGDAFASLLENAFEAAGPEGTVLVRSHAGGTARRPRVLVEALPRHPELLEVLHVSRVPRLGPVDRDAGDVLVVPLVVDGHGRLPAYLANLTR